MPRRTVPTLPTSPAEDRRNPSREQRPRRADKQRRAGQQRAVLEVEAARVEQIRREPRDEEPKRVAAREILAAQAPDRARGEQLLPRRLEVLARSGFHRQQRRLGCVDAGVRARVVADTTGRRATAQITPGRPNSRNAVRQVTCCRHRYTSSGVSAPPSRALIHMMPCARERSCGGSQRLKALVRFGNAPASPAPNRNCVTMSDPQLHIRPRAAVQTDHQMTIRSSTRRGPKRSPR